VSRDSLRSSEFQFDTVSERSSSKQQETGKRKKIDIHRRMTVKGRPAKQEQQIDNQIRSPSPKPFGQFETGFMLQEPPSSITDFKMKEKEEMKLSVV
jgi:hypothetical protein